MQVIRLLVLVLCAVMLMRSCVFPFDPEIEGSQGTLVIQGRVCNQEGYQYVKVSRSILLGRPDKTFPVKGCKDVIIHDATGNVFTAVETQPGFYAFQIGEEYLDPGSRFQLMVTTPDSRTYASDTVELLDCPPIESITWEIEDQPTTDPEITYQGIRFYVSTDAREDYAINYRWELEETWEYHSTYYTWAYYDGAFHLPLSSSDSLYYCWRTRTIPEIYTYSARQLSTKLINNFPLTYVSNRTDRLTIKYSLLVRQYALTPEAYEFWRILEDQSQQSGELYETQPSEITGNIHSLNDPLEKVLGMFYAASVNEKRIFIDPDFLPPVPRCNPYGELPWELMQRLSNYNPGDYPIWLVYDGELETYDFAGQECFDCRLKGGVTTPPDFWE